MSNAVMIPGLGERVPIEARYEYERDKNLCPHCGGLGMPWGGWFSCEDCGAVALVQAFGFWPAGQCFARATESEEKNG